MHEIQMVFIDFSMPSNFSLFFPLKVDCDHFFSIFVNLLCFSNL